MRSRRPVPRWARKFAGHIEKMLKKVSSVSEEGGRAFTLFGKNGYYFWEDLHYNAVELIKELKVPTYIGQGRRDPIVSEEEGRIAYADAIGAQHDLYELQGVPGSQPHFDE